MRAWRTPLAALLLCLLLPAAVAASPAGPVRIDVWSMPGAAAAIDATGTQTLDDALRGRMNFVPASLARFPGLAGPFHPLTIWLRIPSNALARNQTWYLQSDRYLALATLYTPRGTVAYDEAPFGMQFLTRCATRRASILAYRLRRLRRSHRSVRITCVRRSM